MGSGENFKAQVDMPLWVAANPLAWTLCGLDALAWGLSGVGPAKCIAGALQSSQKSTPVSSEPGAPRRRVGCGPDLHTSPFPDCETGVDLLERTYAKFGSNQALGTRQYLGEHDVGARFPIKKFGETSWLTYQQAGDMSKAFGRGLLELGMQPQPAGINFETYDGPSTLMIYEDTSKEWTLSAHGAMTQAVCVATSYATLGMDALVSSLVETNCTVIMTNKKKVAEVAKAALASCPKLKTIIYSNHLCEPGSPAPAPVPGLKIISFEEVVELGKGSAAPVAKPSKDTIAVLMYTSGSTGQPKGVMLAHSALTAAVAGIFHHCKATFIPGDECYLSYLPAAHIMEFTAQLVFFCYGSQIGYACPKTISSKGACRQKPDGTVNTVAGYPHPPGAIQEFRPSMMLAVPKVWDILKKGVEDQISKGSPLIKFLFQTAFSARAAAVSQGREAPLLKIIFKRVAAMMGGRLRNALSGGGPISGDVQTFVRTVFGCNMVQGYALTETCSIGCIQPMDDPRDGIVGVPLSSVEIKLESCKEVMDKTGKPYLCTDTSHLGKPCAGRGEVMIRGAPVSKGYYRQPEKTAEAFTADGWFHTGDIGVYTPDGSMMLVDRLKNLIKLKGGEYIALESMEASYSTSPYCAALNGGVMVYGDGEMDRPVALFQADIAKIKAFAASQGITEEDPVALCKNETVYKEVMSTMLAAWKSGKLGANEKLQAIHIISGTGHPAQMSPDSPWTPENGGLTASNKLQRKPVETALASTLGPLRQKGIF